MTAKVIQGSFLGGQPKFATLAQRRVMPPPIQTKTAARLPGPSAPAFAGRLPGPPAPAFTGPPAMVQRHGSGGAFAVEAGPLGLASGGGKPLPEAVRGKMEAALNADFANVRVHVGPQAERMGAIAFTIGSDIYFAPGRYQPHTSQGQQLLGHELVHVVQQRAGRVRNPLGSGLAVVQDNGLEAEADRLGRHAAAHRIAIQGRLRRSTAQRVGSVTVHGREKRAGALSDLSFSGAQHVHGIGRSMVTSSTAKPGIQFGKSKANYKARATVQMRREFRTNKQKFVVDNQNAQNIRFDQLFELFAEQITDYPTANHVLGPGKTWNPNPEQSRWLYFAFLFLLGNRDRLNYDKPKIKKAARILLDVVTRDQIRARAVDVKSELNFGREVLRIIGYRQSYLAERLKAPDNPNEVRQYFEREEKPQPSDEPLDESLLQSRLPGDLIALMKSHDPGEFKSVELSHDPLSTAQAVNRFARNYFRPYIAAIEKLPVTVGAPLNDQRVVLLEKDFEDGRRVNLLRNRAEQLPVMAEAHFNSSRKQDTEVLDNILRTKVLVASGVRDLVDRHLRVTARHGRGTIRLQSQFQWFTKEHNEEEAIANAQWQRIGTISHELMHFYCHKGFEAKETEVKFGQVIIEGFTDLLGLELLEALKKSVVADNALRERLRGEAAPEAFIEIAQKPLGKSGYELALQRASDIQKIVGERNVRAAYFLGKPELIGL
jgi:Domain of unknown function (DUF4157)